MKGEFRLGLRFIESVRLTIGLVTWHRQHIQRSGRFVSCPPEDFSCECTDSSCQSLPRLH